MVLPSRFQAFAAIAALVAGGSSSSSSSMFASAAVELTVADCSDLAALPTGAMTDDVNLFLDDAIAFTCDEVTTVTVDGPYRFRVTSDNSSVKFTNLRFDIKGGATFTFNLAFEEFLGTATFTGITALDSDGGVFNVESGSSAAFSVPMAFEANSVMTGFSGGAFYAGGKVDFGYDVSFSGNKVLADGDDFAGDGGALNVASTGEVSFDDFAYFIENEAESGGQGGAISNSGSLAFKRASYFLSNTAKEDGDEIGGHGGAIFTEEGSSTVFERRTIMHLNEGASGGAIYNMGDIVLQSAGFIRGNKALGVDRASGGHIYTSGSVSIVGDVNMREGSTRGDGGAVYIDNGGSFTTEGEVNYIDNSASDRCPDVYARGQDPVCQP